MTGETPDMNVKTYVTTLQAQVDDMRQSGRYDDVTFEIYNSMPEGSIEEMENDVAEQEGIPDFRVPDRIKAFYRVANGFKLGWVYVEDTVAGRQPVGTADIASLPELYVPLDEAERPIHYDDGYRTFDNMDVDEQVVLKFHRSVDEPEFYYHLPKLGAYYRLALDFSTYLDLLLQTKGLYPWQHFFIDDPAFRRDEWAERAFFEILPRLFPDADIARFQR